MAARTYPAFGGGTEPGNLGSLFLFSGGSLFSSEFSIVCARAVMCVSPGNINKAVANQPWFAFSFTVVSKRDRCQALKTQEPSFFAQLITVARDTRPSWSALEPVVQPSSPLALCILFYPSDVGWITSTVVVQTVTSKVAVSVDSVGSRDRSDVAMKEGAKPCRFPTRARPAAAAAPKVPPLGGLPDATMTRILLPHPVLVRRRRCKFVPASPQRQCPVARRGTVGLC